MIIVIMGIAWYKEEDYERLLEIFEDSHKLPPTFDKWLQSAEKGFSNFRARGYRVIKVYIDPDTFPVWCRSTGHKIDAKARIDFANMTAARHARDKN